MELEYADKGKTKGKSKCPVSGALFDWTQDVDENVTEVDKFGVVQKTKSFHVSGDD